MSVAFSAVLPVIMLLFSVRFVLPVPSVIVLARFVGVLPVLVEVTLLSVKLELVMLIIALLLAE